MNTTDPAIYLQTIDPVLAPIIQKVPKPIWKPRQDYFKSLVEAIINQQLSGKAADTIIGRFNTLFSVLPYTPESVLRLSDEIIRGVGISYSKVSYIKDLAEKVRSQTLNFAQIHTWDDEAVIKHLTQVKGIGRWSAEMFLMFTLAREDIFSFGDQGLKNAIVRLYKIEKPLTQEKATGISNTWRPYRSWACWYLWASLEM
ncbi:TPA: DNA-3-methyladenine glycosylase 2 family protein [Patescibacteria group bacterium]|uniref:DNA-3-methyladenine glycosylase II n=1 Tax=Candidatus Gottesmanbacteria bacterium GW2011_GWA1_43_11 TaxID=1618436 RepID=A0A0G1CEF7_9BACT|nr:MAG: hypothetical protein UV59_C0032G0017 [Candidatus Gottesmanbacteria bacterium GW2011_GWA1_43_11]HCS78173.1 DNA-3-methyladenine glycosylase 2 family protein [Patescibacteria group bacterium]